MNLSVKGLIILSLARSPLATKSTNNRKRTIILFSFVHTVQQVKLLRLLPSYPTSTLMSLNGMFPKATVGGAGHHFGADRIQADLTIKAAKAIGPLLPETFAIGGNLWTRFPTLQGRVLVTPSQCSQFLYQSRHRRLLSRCFAE